jgi:glutathione S-transferase
MTEPIMLYGDRLWESPYVFSIYVALREKAVPFEVHTLDLDRGEARVAPYSELSLTERVPCIEHRGLAVSESLAIIEYLDEVFLAPSHPAAGSRRSACPSAATAGLVAHRPLAPA